MRLQLSFCAAFQSRWNQQTEQALLDRFRLDVRQKASHLSKGQRTQLALMTAICPEPELLVLDEPTSGLDPIVRREFIQTVIGAYQEGDPGRRTVFVSTHLISEFEGLIDDFTIIDRGRDVLTMNADAAREQFQKIHARFPTEAPPFDLPGCRMVRRQGREIEVIVDGLTCSAAKAIDLFIAPWFTMLCRNSPAGIVFTAATPGLLLLVSQIAAAMRFGTDPGTALVGRDRVWVDDVRKRLVSGGPRPRHESWLQSIPVFVVVEVLVDRATRRAPHAGAGDGRPHHRDVCRGAGIAAALWADEPRLGRAEPSARLASALFAGGLSRDSPDPGVWRVQ